MEWLAIQALRRETANPDARYASPSHSATAEMLRQRHSNGRENLPAPTSSGRALQQLSRDRAPLGGKIPGGDGPAGAAVPVPGVAEVALDPVQVGVDPGALAVGLVLLGDAVRPLPITFRQVPERQQRPAQATRPRVAGEGSLEAREVVHGGAPVPVVAWRVDGEQPAGLASRTRYRIGAATATSGAGTYPGSVSRARMRRADQLRRRQAGHP